MLSQKNISHVFVGANTALATSTVSAMSAGQIGLMLNGGTTLDATALQSGERFQILLKDKAGKLVNSPWLEASNILSKNAQDYTAPTEELVYVGYNGSTGSIAVNNSTVYTMHMNIQDGSKTWGEHPLFKFVAAYESDASATQTEICDALIVNALKNFERETAQGVDYMEIGRINSAAVTLTNDFVGNCVVVKGQNTISVASSGQYATNTDVVLGDYIRLGATTATAVALTSNIYRVTAISGTTTKTYTLDRPVVEPSGTYATGTGTEVILKATVEAANWGIYFKAKPLPYEPGLKKYAKLVFNLQLGDGFGATLLTKSATGTLGQGTYEGVSEVEWLLNGNRGETFRVASYPVNKTLQADSTKTYDTVVVNLKNGGSTQLDHEVFSYMTLIFYVATDTAGTSGSTAYTNLKTVFGL